MFIRNEEQTMKRQIVAGKSSLSEIKEVADHFKI